MQMIEVLIAMTNVVSQHAANQALLVSLSDPLTKALAAWLSTFPSSTLEATHTPESPLTSVPSCASTSARTDIAALERNNSTGAEPNSTAPHTAAHDSSCNAQKLPTSALTSQLKAPKPQSLLTAKLKDSTPPRAKTPTHLQVQPLPPLLQALPQLRGARRARQARGKKRMGRCSWAGALYTICCCICRWMC